MRTIRCAACKSKQRLCAQIHKLKQEKRELRYDNRVLTQQLRELKGMLFKHGTRGKDPPEQKNPPKKRGAPVGHTGRTRTKPTHIDEEIPVRIRRCTQCGSDALTPCARYDDHIQEDIVLPAVKAVRYRHHWFYCRSCKQLVKGIGPGEIPGSFIGPVAKGIANYLHYKSGVSYNKIRDFFDRFFHLDVRKSSIYGFDNQATQKSSALYTDLQQALPAAPYLHIDETGWPHDGKNHWLWCLANDQVVFYHIDTRRNATVVTDTIGDQYNGAIITDFYRTYDKLLYLQQKCLVHLLRISKRLRERFAQSSRVRTFCRRLDTLIKRIIAIRKRVHTIKKVLLYELRADIKARLKLLLATPLPYPKAEKFRKALAQRQHELTLCLDLPHIPSHNNFVERQIRPNVILRKITFGTRSPAGIRNHQTLMSLIQTAALHKYPIMDLLHGIHVRQKISVDRILNHSP